MREPDYTEYRSREAISKAITDLSTGDRVTWWDVNGDHDEQTVSGNFENRGVSIGVPTGNKWKFLSKQVFIASMGGGKSLPTYGMELEKLRVWHD